MKTNNSRLIISRAVSCVFLIFACFYMYDFYKCLSGFIANGFREPLVMLPMILAYLLPVVCFLFFFYDFFIRAPHPVARVVSSILVAIWAAVDMALIFSNIGLYVSNNSLGVYDTLPSIIVHFPYDMIAVLFCIFALQMFDLFVVGVKKTGVGARLDEFKCRGSVKVCIPEYIALSVIAIVVFVFTGAAICAAFTAYENAFYDVRYVFLVIWVMAVPMMNLLIMTLKPERKVSKKGIKLAILGGGIGINILFALLFVIFEFTYPDFLIHIGKPLFLIAFSVSIPIEPFAIFLIMLIGSISMAVRFIIAAIRVKKSAELIDLC